MLNIAHLTIEFKIGPLHNYAMFLCHIGKDLCIIIEQLNKNFGRRGSTLNRVCHWNMFHCCCVPDCSNMSNRERHLSFLALSLKNKMLLKRWVHVIR